MDAEKLKGFAPVAALLALENDLDRFDYLADLALDTPALTRERCTEEARVASCDSKLWILLEKQKKRVALQSQSDCAENGWGLPDCSMRRRLSMRIACAGWRRRRSEFVNLQMKDKIRKVSDHSHKDKSHVSMI